MRRCEKIFNTICFTTPLVNPNPDKPEMNIDD
jgi:hypothetical protein